MAVPIVDPFEVVGINKQTTERIGIASGTRDLLPVWERWATDLRGRGLACGHFIPEEAPEELLAVMVPFLEGVEGVSA